MAKKVTSPPQHTHTHMHTDISLAEGLPPMLEGDTVRLSLLTTGKGNWKKDLEERERPCTWNSVATFCAKCICFAFQVQRSLARTNAQLLEVLFVWHQSITRTCLPPLSLPGQAPSSVTELSSEPPKRCLPASVLVFIYILHAEEYRCLRPHGLQHTRLLCPSGSPGVCSNSHASSRWPSYPLSSPSPSALNLSKHQGLFQWVSSSHLVAKVLELWHQSFQWIFRVDFL